MFCFVDFRNRPQTRYTFRSRQSAREHLRKIQNNSLGATIIHADGRREYFANGLPALLSRSAGLQAGIPANSQDNFRILKGCHVKYKIRPLAVLDGVVPTGAKTKRTNAANWKTKTASPLFMLGNLKFSACLLVFSLLVFSSTYLFQKNLGQAAVAEQIGDSTGIVLGASDSRSGDSGAGDVNEEDVSLQLADEEVIMSLIGKIDDEKHSEFRSEITQYIKGRPMEAMAPYIAKQPRIVAAFLVGIAMKESKFGVYSPKLGGRDCYNYWGFKGGGTTTSGGYTCFDSTEQAIQVVGRRIAKLVDGGRTNPAAMVVWKCGSSCSWDRPENVSKWIADVGVNFYKLNSKS